MQKCGMTLGAANVLGLEDQFIGLGMDKSLACMEGHWHGQVRGLDGPVLRLVSLIGTNIMSLISKIKSLALGPGPWP